MNSSAPIPAHRNVAMYVPHQAGRVKEESRLLYLGGRGARVTVYTAQYSTHVQYYSYNEQHNGKGERKLIYKISLAQLLQFLVLALTNLGSKFLQ